MKAWTKELEQIARDAALGKRLADKLFKVWRRNGQVQIVLIHIEIQGERVTLFAERMWIYNYRTYDRYRQPVVSLAVLTDDDPNWRPNRFHYDLWGCEVGIKFPIVKLIDYNDHPTLLETSRNPFAIAVWAHLKTRATRDDYKQRLYWKMRLVRALYERGFERKDVLELFRFMDWLLYLPEELAAQFEDQLEKYEAEKKMQYVTSIERKGIHKGETKMLKRLLAHRFGPLPDWVGQRLEQADHKKLEAWFDRGLKADSVEKVFEDE